MPATYNDKVLQLELVVCELDRINRNQRAMLTEQARRLRAADELNGLLALALFSAVVGIVIYVFA